MTTLAYNDQILGRPIRLILVDMVDVYANVVSRCSAYLAGVIRGVKNVDGFGSVFVRDAMDALARKCLPVVLLAVQCRSFAQFLWAHRALAFLAGIGPLVGCTFAFAFRALNALRSIFLVGPLPARHAQTSVQPLDLINSVVMQPKPTGRFHGISVGFSEHSDDWSSFDLGSAGHQSVLRKYGHMVCPCNARLSARQAN